MIAILGDFKLSVLGMPEVESPDTQIVDTIVIEKGSTLYISDIISKAIQPLAQCF